MSNSSTSQLVDRTHTQAGAPGYAENSDQAEQTLLNKSFPLSNNTGNNSVVAYGEAADPATAMRTIAAPVSAKPSPNKPKRQ